MSGKPGRITGYVLLAARLTPRSRLAGSGNSKRSNASSTGIWRQAVALGNHSRAATSRDERVLTELETLAAFPDGKHQHGKLPRQRNPRRPAPSTLFEAQGPVAK